MIIEISGLQCAGKSTLIGGLTGIDYKLYKFPMGGVCKQLKIHPTWEMQIAKDISTLELCTQLCKDDIIISDRGPLSTLYYSLLFKRATDEEVWKFIQHLSQYKDRWFPVWLEGVNNEEAIAARSKNDGFDNMMANTDPTLANIYKAALFYMLREAGIKYTIVKNNFENSVEDNIKSFNSAINKIIEVSK